MIIYQYYKGFGKVKIKHKKKMSIPKTWSWKQKLHHRIHKSLSLKDIQSWKLLKS